MARKSMRLTAALTASAAAFFVLAAAASLPARVGPSRARPVVPSPARRGEAREEFMRRVYEAQKKLLAGRQPFAGLPEDRLEVVEGGHKMLRAAAGQCKLLLKQAKSDLRREQARGNEDALKVSDIGVHSGYRSVGQDEAAWRNAFNKQFHHTKNARAKLKGGEYGDEAVALMVSRMRMYKAVPGYSKHTRGLAVDFKTTDGGVRLSSNSSQNGRWKKSWFHKWLDRNAKRFKFKPLATEAWHWEYAK